MNLTYTDWLVGGGLLALSVVYAVGLQHWQRHFPESYDDLTWLTVVIGCGYVLLLLALVLPLEWWLRVCGAFFVACIPIIFRSVWNLSRRRRQANGRLERGG